MRADRTTRTDRRRRSAPLRRLTAAAAAAALAATGLALAAPASAEDYTGYYKTTYDPTIYAASASGALTKLTYEQWRAAGFPVPEPALQNYYRFSWSPTLYRTTQIVFTVLEDFRPITAAEWAVDGRPAPSPSSPGPEEVEVYRWGTSDELFARTPDGAVHKLTPAEWNSVGQEPPIRRDGEGFIKLTWSGDIAFGSELGVGGGSPIDYSRWAAEAFPTPRQDVRFPKDQFVRRSGSSTITYSGPTMSRAITYAEWTAAGRPEPTIR